MANLIYEARMSLIRKILKFKYRNKIFTERNLEYEKDLIA